ncbi:unnamed protein product [Peronospora belbahrii]|uniref:Uncharacterized protein n=1 Tax=Peronospora belbahrii TaxID=622444 RepID=A0ABN8CWC9_9STRA|nr:unnamed protein product [Peronospora belbahrii]
MHMLRTGFKMAVLAAAVACYVQPQVLLQPFIELELDTADAQVMARVLRGLLTLLSYGLASFRPSWLYVVVVVAALQLILWGLQMFDDSMIGLSVEEEKKMFLTGAVTCFGVIVSILLFGGKSDDRARFRKRLVAFYTKHNPEKLRQVDELVEKYELNEELLFQRLHRKYNALAAGSDSHSVMKKIDESEFLYEEEEEERVESDEETTGLVDKEAVVYPMKKSFGRDRNDGGFEAAGKKSGGTVVSIARQPEIEDYDRLDGTPPVSPRTAEKLAHTHRQSSTLINKAIELARRAQQERIERRIANIASKSGDGYAGH